MAPKIVFAAIASLVLVSAGMTQAASTVLVEGGIVAASTTSVALPGTVLATQTQSFTGANYTGKLVSTIISGDGTNPNGGLTFTYQLSNDATSTGFLDGLQLPGFTGFLTSVGQQGSGISFFNVFRGLPGLGIDGPGVVDFRWAISNPIDPTENSQLLVIHTDATNWLDTSGRIIDGSFAAVQTYGPTAGVRGGPLPAVPLPSAVLMGIPTLLGAIFIARKRK
jgi:hypothetical protein